MAEKPLTTFGGTATVSPATLSAIFAALGSLEPACPDDELTAIQFDRQDIVFSAAAHLPVRSSGDAALALSAAASGLDGVLHYELTEGQRERAVQAAVRSIAAVASWVMTEHGGVPVASAWPAFADPFSRVAAAV